MGRPHFYWLSNKRALELLDAPSPHTLKGKRDRFILGLLLRTGLSRAQIAGLKFDSIQKKGKRFFVLLNGARDSRKSVPLQAKVKSEMDRWIHAAKLSRGYIFRPVDRWDRIGEGAMTPQAVHEQLKLYGTMVGLHLAPFVPSSNKAVQTMLRVAGVCASDVVYDLGCGDGRIVAAAAQLGARSVGIDIDPHRLTLARARVDALGVSHRVKLIAGDFFNVNLRPATVVAMFLVPYLNLKLLPKLTKELRPGTRLVSHGFDLGVVNPDYCVRVNKRKVYYWIAPLVASRRRRVSPRSS